MDAPLGYFLRAAGPAAQPVLVLDWVFTSICICVCLIVACLLAYGLFRRRGESIAPRDDDGLALVYSGGVFSACALLGMTSYMLATLNHISAPSERPRISITVTAYQWWWQIEY